MFAQRMKSVLPAPQPSRRGFLKLSLGAGAGLVIGAHMPGIASAATESAAGDGVFNPFVKIAPDSSVTVFIKHLDKGQGVYTGLSTLVAEELNATREQLAPEFAPADATTYNNLLWGPVQGSGGSTAIANSWEQYRKAGATARAMLVAAAAESWGVPAAEIMVSAGVISHPGGNQATFGEFAEAASRLPIPETVPLKTPEQYVYIGKAFPRLDSDAKSTGQATYTQDIQLDGMLVAVLTQPPKFGATVAAYDDTDALAVNGVEAVVQVPQGVAVIANSTWAAMQGREVLSIDWDETAAETRGSDEILAEYRAAADTPGTVLRDDEGVEEALAGAATIIEREYVFPYLSHAPMEPMNAVVQITGDGAIVWTGSQVPTIDQGAAAAVLGLQPQQVDIRTLFAGGSFGRRAMANGDYVAQAAAIAKAHGQGQPIKLIYTREDDMRGGYYRPLMVHRVRAGLDADGNIVGWHHRIVGQPILRGTPFEGMLQGGPDITMIEGAHPTAYALPRARFELHEMQVGVPVLWWRSVGHTHTAYVMETMIDELAIAAGKDPVAYRLSLLGEHPRHRGVLELAAEKAGWDTPLPEGRFRGVAVHESFSSYVAEVAEISADDGILKVEKVTIAVDCGTAVNPDQVVAQMEGGMGYGLSAALREKLIIAGGEVEDGNYDTYTPLRISDMPEVDVHIVPSSEAPTGVGEPGTPPIAPAVANAWAAATGDRITSLPFTDHDIVA